MTRGQHIVSGKVSPRVWLAPLSIQLRHTPSTAPSPQSYALLCQRNQITLLGQGISWVSAGNEGGGIWWVYLKTGIANFIPTRLDTVHSGIYLWSDWPQRPQWFWSRISAKGSRNYTLASGEITRHCRSEKTKTESAMIKGAGNLFQCFTTWTESVPLLRRRRLGPCRIL